MSKIKDWIDSVRDTEELDAIKDSLLTLADIDLEVDVMENEKQSYEDNLKKKDDEIISLKERLWKSYEERTGMKGPEKKEPEKKEKKKSFIVVE